MQEEKNAHNREQEKVEKILHSPIERALQKLNHGLLGPRMPQWMTAMRMTGLGAIACIIAVICAVLSRFSYLWLIGTVLGLLTHLIADDLDGYLAKARNQGSDAGAFFDLMTDVVFSTFLILAFGTTPYVHMETAAFMAPIYGVINVALMMSVIYLKQFPLPVLGPAEAHFAYIALCIAIPIFGDRTFFTFLNIPFTFGDIIMTVGGGAMHIVTIYTLFDLFFKMKKKDAKD